QYSEDGRMHVHMQMAVDVREIQARSGELLHLREYLSSQFGSNLFGEIVTKTRNERTVRKISFDIDEVRNLGGRQCGLSADQHQMESDRQSRALFRKLDGLLKSFAAHH